MFVLSEALAYPFSFLFLRDDRQLVLNAVHAFRIISFTDALKSTVNKKSSELKKPATAKKATKKKASSK